MNIEKATISAMCGIFDGKKNTPIDVSFLNKLDDEDFTNLNAKKVLKAAQELAKDEKPINVITLSHKDKSTDSFIIECHEENSFTPFFQLCYILREERIERDLKRKVREIATSKNASSELREYIEKLNEIRFEEIKDDISEHTLDYLDNIGKKGLMTGFDPVDNNTDGLIRGDYWIIGGYSNTGKTQFAMHIVRNLLETNAKIGFITLEMIPRKLVSRLVHILTTEGMNRDMACQKIIDKKEKLKIASNISNIDEIESYIQKENFDVVFIDYLQLIHTEDDNEYQRITNISHRLNDMKLKYKTCIVALSQVNEAFQNQNNMRTVGFKGSGAIGNDCDTGFIIQRDFDAEKELGAIVPLHINMRKNRSGRQGFFEVSFDREKYYIYNKKIN